MNLLLHLVHVCHFSVIFSSFNGYGYILFAANIDDFKMIAKKYMPDMFAEKLVKIAADTSLFELDDGNKPKNDTVRNIKKDIGRSRPEIPPGTILDHDKEVTQTLSSTTLNNEKNKKIPLAGLNIDDLVEKIKERLDKQYMEKYKNFMVSVTSNVPQTVEYSQTTRDVEITHAVKGKNLLRKPKDSEYDYDNTEQANGRHPDIQPLIKNHQQHEVVQEVGQIEFEEKDLTYSNDSYEDYKVPPKYETRERNYPTSERNINKASTTKSPYKLNIVKKPKNYDYAIEHLRYDDVDGEDQAQNEGDKFKSSEIKAQTENLGDDNYDDKVTEGNDNPHKVIEDNQHSYKVPQDNPKSYKVTDGNPNSFKVTQGTPVYKNTRKVVSRMVKGTGIPTRERFSMSSPNYYASVAIVAEKYDFNEPLPEKDREPEDLRYFKNQPSRINKKVAI